MPKLSILSIVMFFALSLLGLAACGAEATRALKAPAMEDRSLGSLDASVMDLEVNEEPPEASASQPARRRILETSMGLKVADLGVFAEKLRAALDQHGGWIESSDEDFGQYSRTGTWQVRFPVGKQEVVLAAVRAMGKLVRESTSSRDVGDQLVDLAARLKAQRQLEARFLQLLAGEEAKAGTLEQVLLIERELARVRTEIERLDARRLSLEQRADFGKLTVSAAIEEDRIREETDPAFGAKAATTWDRSTRNLVRAGETLLLALIALVPWLPLLLVIAFLIHRNLKRRDARRGRRDVVMPTGSD